MFRPIARFKQEISREECIRILKEELRGVLSVNGDDGYPYGSPINHWYNEEDGNIYFHGGKKGHKIDAMKNCPKASFCVMDKGFVKEGEWALNIRSVIVFGKMEFIEDQEEAMEITRKLSLKFTPDLEYIEEEIKHSAAGTLVYRLVPQHICGKLVNES